MPAPLSAPDRNLNIGLAEIRRWREVDEVHLPTEKAKAPLFLPEMRPLDAILKRETLDERLNRQLAPDSLDAELLSPAVLAETRTSLADKLGVAGSLSGGSAFARATEILEREIVLDREVQEALSALLQG